MTTALVFWALFFALFGSIIKWANGAGDRQVKQIIANWHNSI